MPDAAGVWGGWEIEIINAVCGEAKLDCVLTPTAWDGIIPALTSKKIDLIMNSMSITGERLKTIDFSDKYYNTPTAIAGAKTDTFAPTPEGLAGKIIGRPFDADQLKAIGAGMEPNSSAIVVIVEDTAAQQLAAAAGIPGANVVTVTLGSQLSGELAQFAAVELGEDTSEAAPEAAEAETTAE